MTRKQTDSQLCYQQSRLCVTASSFGKRVKWQNTTPVANWVPQANGHFFTALKEETQGRCSPSLHIAHKALLGQAVAVQACELVIYEVNPCLAYSPDARSAGLYFQWFTIVCQHLDTQWSVSMLIPWAGRLKKTYLNSLWSNPARTCFATLYVWAAHFQAIFTVIIVIFHTTPGDFCV